jgi:hypothetical protein
VHEILKLLYGERLVFSSLTVGWLVRVNERRDEVVYGVVAAAVEFGGEVTLGFELDAGFLYRLFDGQNALR